jgi:YD repeat-containing protein
LLNCSDGSPKIIGILGIPGSNACISETNALGKTRTFTYDPAGNSTGITDRNGKTRRFSFDARDR